MARRLEDEDDTPEEKLEATKWKESWMRPWVRWGFPFGGFSEAAGSGRQTTTGWTLEEGQPRHRQRRPGQWLVAVAAAVGREGSKRSVVAAAGVVVLLRKRWVGMELMMGVESDRHGPATGRRRRYARRKIGSYEVEGELDETLGLLGVPFWGVLS